MTNMIKISV